MDNFYALIVGVGGKAFPETVNDAEDIHEVLITKGGYNPHNTYLLIEDKSTKKNIINAFDEIIKKTEGVHDSTVFIYYSGHGQRVKTPSNEFAYYLQTHGADFNNIEDTMLNGDIFSEKVDKIIATRMLVMLDCCHAGGMKTEEAMIRYEDDFGFSNIELQEKLNKGSGRVLISSCSDHEESVIIPGHRNSLFTEVTLEALSGHNSQNREFVSILDLILYVLNEVPNRVQPFGHNQNPYLTEATDVNHRYYICKNEKWRPHS